MKVERFKSRSRFNEGSRETELAMVHHYESKHQAR